MSKKVIGFTLRLDPELKIKAEKQAKQDRRSLNSWLQVAVEEKLKRESEVAA